jgi:hypothetical protein
VIPNQYIVVFRDDVRSPAAAAGEMANAHGLKLRHTYSHTIRGFSAVVPEGRLEALRRHPRVRSVQPNRYLYIDTHERFRRPVPAAQLGVTLVEPSGLTATALSGSEIRLTWTDESDDETGFEIARSAGAAGPFSKVASVKANVTEYVDGELASAVEYCYKVRAFSGRGQKNKQYSSYTSAVCAATDAGGGEEPPSDGRPTNLNAEPGTGADIVLIWDDNSDNETDYAIERCGPALPGSACLDFRGLALVEANTTTYIDANVTANLEYCYRVKGMRQKGKKITYTEYSNTDCAVPSPVLVPEGGATNLSATAISHRAIDVEWTDDATGEHGFEILRSTDGVNFTTIHITGLGVTFYLDDGRVANTTYTYRVFAVNAVGPSTDYEEASATTHAEPTGDCWDSGNHDDIDTQLWNIRRVRAHRNAKWQATQLGGTCALQARLFILDTGVDLDADELRVAETGHRCFLDGCTSADDVNGHGTHVAGIAAAIDGNGGVVGVAPGAPIYAFKVCNDDGTCPADAVMAGIDEVTGRKNAATSQPMVVNLSLSGSGTNDDLETAVRLSVNAGVVYAIAAGNGELGACFFPGDAQYFTPARVGDDKINASGGTDGDVARTNGAIVTTASDLSDGDDNCNYGDPVTVAAPGVDILSTAPGNTTATMGGSSMATPHVAGAAILFLQDNPGASPYDVEDAILMWLNTGVWVPGYTPNADGRLEVEKL